MALHIVLLVVGFLCLIKGSDYFVDSSCSIAKRLQIPTAVVGLTIVAIGTSLPEASVSITASLAGKNELAISNVIGSNLFNLLAIIGICALVRPLTSERQIMRRDVPISLLAAALVLVLSADGRLGRWDGVLLLACFVAYTVWLIVDTLRKRVPEEREPVGQKLWKSIVFIVVGLAAIVVGGKLVVNSASAIASALGLSDTVIGLTIVAIGTSLPELATSVTAMRRGETDLAWGNVAGSNVANILFILGVASAISPIDLGFFDRYDCLFLIAVTLLAWILSRRRTTRAAGGIYVALYVIFAVAVVLRALPGTFLN